MRFFNVCLAAAVPAAVFASPLAERAAVPEVGLSDVSASLAAPELAARQDLGSELGGILANLTATLHELEILLSPDSLADVEDIVVNAAKLLSSNNTNVLVTLIQGAGALLDSPLVGDLTKLLPGLLSALPKLGGLINGQMIQNITDIVSNAHDLLDPTMVTDTKGLIEDVYPIVNDIGKLLGGLLGGLSGGSH
jgi:hypothetical protein